MSVPFRPELQARIEALVSRYPRPRAALLPVLHLVQEARGSIGVEEEEDVSRTLGLSPLEVREVVTFYSMFRRHPVGRHHLQVCTNLTCTLLGGARVLDHLVRVLGIKPGETTADGRISLTTVECLGACDEGPCLDVGAAHHGLLTEEKLDALLGELD
jgi:NADH-quinone oxidoreductase subunit E